MSLDISKYYSQQEWENFTKESQKYDTPFVLINLDIIEKNLAALRQHCPFAKIYPAIKACPADETVSKLLQLNNHFDLASIGELDLIIRNGGDPSQMSYGNTIKKTKDIEYFYSKGCRLYVSDSEADVRNLAKYAPGSNVFFRVLIDSSTRTAEWPLSKKFGSDIEMAKELILLSKELGLNPIGISFHVGSQQNNPKTWDSALTIVKSLFNYCSTKGIELKMINIGGGFPTHYIAEPKDLSVYAKDISNSLKKNWGTDIPEIIMEPGRSLFGNAGILVSEVILIEKKSIFDVDKWLYLDAGLFNGLMETMGESIKYPLYCEAAGNDSTDFIIAGPTCDSADILYRKYRNPLPEGIKIGDRVYVISAGAYTSSYATVNFNCFPPIKTYFIKNK